eukprot:5096751-Alexandrium_andersonii.AAC.1
MPCSTIQRLGVARAHCEAGAGPRSHTISWPNHALIATPSPDDADSPADSFSCLRCGGVKRRRN